MCEAHFHQAALRKSYTYPVARVKMVIPPFTFILHARAAAATITQCCIIIYFYSVILSEIIVLLPCEPS